MAGKEKIDTAAWVKLRERLGQVKHAGRVKVGVLASAGPVPGEAFTMAELAAVHEFGSPAAHIPERSFLRRTFDLRRRDIHKLVENVTEHFVEGTYSIDQALGVLGEWMVAAVRNTIVSRQVVPRLEESEAGRRTIARKKSTLTLVDTGRLLSSIAWEKEEK